MNKKKLVFVALLVVGVGLCVGGIFLPVLVPIGAAAISGAVSVGLNLVQSGRPDPQAHPDPVPSDSREDQCDENIEVAVHLEHRSHHGYALRQSTHKPIDDIEVEHKEEASNHPRKSHKHHP